MQGNFLSIISEVLKYGGATFAALVAMSIYTTTDGFFIGNWIGTDGLEAMALIFPVTLAFSALGFLFEIGGSAVVSEKIGMNQKSLAEKIMRTNYVFVVVTGLIIAFVGNIFIDSILNFLSEKPNEQYIISLAISFLRISFWGLPFLLIIYLTGAFMRCIDKPVHVFYLVGITSLANIILDALFIVVFNFGIEGAASATLLAQILGTAISFWYFKYSSQKFVTSWEIESLSYIWREIKIGGGFAIGTLMMCVIEYFFNATLLKYDAAHLLASATIANIILTFIYLPLNGLDTGIQPLISKLFSAKKYEYCFSVMRYGFFLTMFLSFIMYLLLMIFTEELANIFSDEPLTKEMISFLRFAFLLQPFVGIFTWLSGIMSALEDEWRNFVISLMPLIIQVPAIWFLPKVLPVEYMALNFSIQDVADATIAFLLIRSFFREKNITFKKIFNVR